MNSALATQGLQGPGGKKRDSGAGRVEPVAIPPEKVHF